MLLAHAPLGGDRAVVRAQLRPRPALAPRDAYQVRAEGGALRWCALCTLVLVLAILQALPRMSTLLPLVRLTAITSELPMGNLALK